MRAKNAPPADLDDPRLRRLERFADLLDSRFRVPGTDFRFGVDGLVGLIPGIGDTVTAVGGFYIIHQAWELGVRRRTLARMAGNLLIDALFGAVPVLGDAFDLVWKSNLRNIRLATDDIRSQAARRRAARPRNG
ncbi:MAG: DUF4112 domain-containing protein [Rhodospirillaceae bacterium]